MKLLIGIDLGTTLLKVCAFRAPGGKLVARAQRRLEVQTPQPDQRELRMPSLDRAFGSVMAELLGSLGGSFSGVVGLGLASQGGSGLLADRTTGRALTPMILWNDRRARREQAEVEQKRSPLWWRRNLLCNHVPAGLGRLRWLRRHRGELFRDSTIHVGAGEYLFHRLTGVWRQDAGHALQIGSFHPRLQRLDGAFLRLVDIPLSFVPPLRAGHSTVPLCRKAARRYSLPEGVPVAGPYIDQEAGYLSSAGTTERPLHCSLGTAWVGNVVLPRGVRSSAPLQLVVPSPAGPGCLVILPLLIGNPVWEWALHRFLGSCDDGAFASAERILGSSCYPLEAVVAVPWVGRPTTALPGLQSAGLVCGVSLSTTRDDLLAAVAAGMTFELARVIGPVCRDAASAVVLGGGASKAAFFRRWIAALLDPLPVLHQSEGSSPAARGALYPLDRKVALAPTRRVPRGSRELRRRARSGLECYVEVFKTFLESDPSARSVVLQRTKR